MKKTVFSIVLALAASVFVSAQNVGIGTINPDYNLEVIGSIRSSSNTYVGGFLGIGTTNPNHKLQINDGSIAIFNTADFKTWRQTYNSTDNTYQFLENSTPRLVIANGGFVGIGTTNPNYKLQVNDGTIAIFNSTDSKTWLQNYNAIGNYYQFVENLSTRMVIANGGNVGINTTSPDYRLDINGTANVQTNLTVGGTAAIDGNVTMNGKGLLYNAASSAKLRYFTRTAAVSVVNLAAHGLSAEFSINFSGFTSPPEVFVGDIVSTGGTTGPLYKCQLVIYAVTASDCKARISNTSASTINQDITWNISCIGAGN
jgi:hypothetical protein